MQALPRSLAKCARTYENKFHISARIVPTTRKNGGTVVKKQIGVDSNLSYICAGSGAQPRNVHMRLHTLTPASICIRNQFFRSYTCALVRLLVRCTFVTASVRRSYPQSSPRLFGSKHHCLQFTMYHFFEKGRANAGNRNLNGRIPDADLHDKTYGNNFAGIYAAENSPRSY